MTERELLKDQPQKLYKLCSLISQGVINIEDVAEIIPGIMHINSREDLGIEYISQAGCDIIRYSQEEIKSLGAELLYRHQSDYTINIIYPKLFKEIKKNDPNHVIPFFQDWRYKKGEDAVFHFTSTKILNDKHLISISLFPHQIETMSRTINKMFGIDKIYSRHFAAYQTLTKREKQILFHLGEELTRKEVAFNLFISELTVKNHCETIYKKLGTSKRTELEKIARAFEGL